MTTKIKEIKGWNKAGKKNPTSADKSTYFRVDKTQEVWSLLPSVQLYSVFQLSEDLSCVENNNELQTSLKQLWQENALKAGQGKHHHTWGVFSPQGSFEVGIKCPRSSVFTLHSFTDTPDTFGLQKKRFVCFHLPRMQKEEPPWEFSLC